MQKLDIVICEDDSNSNGNLKNGSLYRVWEVKDKYLIVELFVLIDEVNPSNGSCPQEVEGKWHKNRFRKVGTHKENPQNNKTMIFCNN